MAVFDSSKLFFMAKIEATQGTDSVPVVGTNDIVALRDSAGISRGVNRVDGVRVASPFGGVLVSPNANTMPTASIKIPIYGKGLQAPGVIVLPTWVTAILATCCNVFIGSGDTSQCLLTPDVTSPTTTDSLGTATANNRTFTLYQYAGMSGSEATGTKILTTMTGCMIARAAWRFKVGEVSVLELDIVGQTVSVPSEVTTNLSAATLDGIDGTGQWVVQNGLATTLTPNGGSALNCLSRALDFTWEFGAQHVPGDNSGSGVATVALDDINVKGTIDPIVAVGDVAAWLAPITNATWYALGCAANGVYPSTRSADTGYGFKVAGSYLQAEQGPDVSRDDRVLRLPISFVGKRGTISGAEMSVQIW